MSKRGTGPGARAEAAAGEDQVSRSSLTPFGKDRVAYNDAIAAGQQKYDLKPPLPDSETQELKLKLADDTFNSNYEAHVSATLSKNMTLKRPNQQFQLCYTNMWAAGKGPLWRKTSC